MPWHPARRPSPNRTATDTFDFPWEDLLAAPAGYRLETRRADCCVSPASYRAIVRAGADRGRVELLLCGHHFRRSQSALAATGVGVFDMRDHLVR
jgi:hypothetical protein